ncbi:MAG: RNA-binding S4 domain-containing protein [Pseudomonadota bacterium]
MTESQPGIRLDKWLWYCRFFKTRALAAKAVTSGARVNGVRLSKASALVRPGDEITFKQARSVRYVRVEALGERRGPAPEAQTLYTDLAPAQVAD